MPGPELDPITSDTQLPKKTDVVIIGGGIAGVCAALELAERGKRVVICEKGQIGAEQSSRNWGWVRLTHRDPREMPLMVEAVRLWENMNTRIEGETGYRQCGSMYAFSSKAGRASEEAALKAMMPYQIPARILTRAECVDRFEGLSIDIDGALHNPQDGRAEPQKAAPAIARAVQDLGGKIFQNCAVRVVETSEGKVSAVATEQGTIRCSSVLLAGGAWSRMFLGNLGIYLPQLSTRNSVLRTKAIAGGPQTLFKCSDFAVRQRLDGGLTIASAQPSRYQLTPDSFRLLWAFLPTLKGEWRSIRLSLGSAFFKALGTRRKWTSTNKSPFEATRVLDPAPDIKNLSKTLEVAKTSAPSLESVDMDHAWAGEIDVVPDVIPVISPTEGVKNGVPGLFVATGFSGHGFGLGPAAGRLAADLITGQTPCVDPAPFRLHRFSDGSRIAPMPKIIQS